MSFYILDHDVIIDSKNNGADASFPLAILSLRPGKKLLVTALYQHESNMQGLVQHAVNHMNADTAWRDVLKGFQDGHVFG